MDYWSGPAGCRCLAPLAKTTHPLSGFTSGAVSPANRQPGDVLCGLFLLSVLACRSFLQRASSTHLCVRVCTHLSLRIRRHPHEMHPF